MIRVFIADDHEVVRAGLRQAISGLRDLTLVGECADGHRLLEATQKGGIDVVVMDVNMPGCLGARTVRKIRTLEEPPRIIVFTMYAEDSHAFAFFRAGAAAFLSKRRSTTDLVEAIRKVHAGGRYLTPDLAEYLFESGIDLDKPATDLLSERELEVVRLLAAGVRATDIAGRLGLAVSTVNTFVLRIKRKLGVKSVVEVVRLAEDNELLS